MKKLTHILVATLLTAGFAVRGDVTIPDDFATALSDGKMIADETIADCGALTISSSIDLNGHALTLSGVTSVSWDASATLTSDAALDATGRLEIVHSCAVEQPESASFTGKLQFVKGGSGTWKVNAKSQTFTGGVIVEGGTLTSSKYGNFAEEETPFGLRPTIEVADGTLDFYGEYGHAATVVNLRGGTVKSSRTVSNEDYKMRARVNLLADSTFATDKDKIYDMSGPLDLGGHTLTLDFGASFRWRPSSATNGVIRLASGTLRVPDPTAMPTVSLVAESALDLAADLSVLDYVACASVTNTGTGALHVFGAFRPVAETFFPPTMETGSTIDLSVCTSARPFALTNGLGQVIRFAEDAEVFVEIGEHALLEGEMLAAWSASADYAGRSFTLVANGVVSTEFELQPLAAGLKVRARGARVPTAVWEGAIDADALKSDNWRWENKLDGDLSLLPNGTHVVRIDWTKLAGLNWPETNALGYATLEFSGEKPTESVVLSGDRDWRGLGEMKIPFSLDLNGKTLSLRLAGEASTNACEVTSSATGGVLRAEVASGVTHENETVSLSGSLDFIKEGSGVYVLSRDPQTYEGRTILKSGVLRCVAQTNVCTVAGGSPFGARRAVDVVGGALDPAGSYCWEGLSVNLRGGIISNTVEQLGRGTSWNHGAKNVFDPAVNLYTNAVFATTETFNFQGSVALLGEATTLDLSVPSKKRVMWNPQCSTNLHLRVTGGGNLEVWARCPFRRAENPGFLLEMCEASLTLPTYDLYLGGMEVTSYVSSGATDGNTGRAVLSVSGVFTPVGEVFYGCTMEDGSTLDLSRRDSVWMTTSADANDKTRGTVDFADGATVQIELGTRSIRTGTRIVGWTAADKPVNLDTLRFVLHRVDAHSPGRIETRDEGLYFMGGALTWGLW